MLRQIKEEPQILVTDLRPFYIIERELYYSATQLSDFVEAIPSPYQFPPTKRSGRSLSTKKLFSLSNKTPSPSPSNSDDEGGDDDKLGGGFVLTPF